MNLESCQKLLKPITGKLDDVTKPITEKLDDVKISDSLKIKSKLLRMKKVICD